MSKRFTEEEMLNIALEIQNNFAALIPTIVEKTINVRDERQIELARSLKDFAEKNIDERLSAVELNRRINEIETISLNGPNRYVVDGPEERFIVISDLHFPFHLKEGLKLIEDIYGGKGYNLILLGDILDCYDISSFPKRMHITLREELDIFTKYLTSWSRSFKNIYMASGNHEKRMQTYLSKRLPSGIMDVLTKDIIKTILGELKLSNVHYCDGETSNWWIQVNNVVLVHPSSSVSRVPLSTVEKWSDTFLSRGVDADIFISGHTHKLGMIMEKRKLFIESGCMCLPQDYAMDGKFAFPPEVTGFVTFTSRYGKVSQNEVRLQFI